MFLVNLGIPGSGVMHIQTYQIHIGWVNLRSFVGKTFGVKYFVPRNVEPYNGLFHHFHPCLCRVIGPQFVKLVGIGVYLFTKMGCDVRT